MSIPPLAIIQARLNSHRLPGKMLLPVGGEPLIVRVWRRTCHAFGARNTVVAHPDTPDNARLVDLLDSIDALQRFAWQGPEWDVLDRFYFCAHAYRWRPETVIMRVTPDDPFKSPSMMRRVANGERLPVELGAEAFTLEALDHWRRMLSPDAKQYREHLTHTFFPVSPPPAPPGRVWSIDTQQDYEAVCAHLAEHGESRYGDDP